MPLVFLQCRKSLFHFRQFSDLVGDLFSLPAIYISCHQFISAADDLSTLLTIYKYWQQFIAAVENL